MKKPEGFRIVRQDEAVRYGFSPDKRKRRRQHRRMARSLLGSGGVFNNCSARGSTFYEVSRWHLWCARVWGR